MQYYQDTVSAKVYAFNPDVVCTEAAGVWSFTSAAGVALAVPTTLQPCTNNTPPPPPVPTLVQRAQGLLGGLLTVTSTGTPALNGSYAIDPGTQAHMQAEMLCVTVTGAFADTTATLAWLDTGGTAHTFPSTAEFKAFALAVAAFVAACFKVINGTSTTLPSASVTIA
jgi:hypothetical protein